MPDSFFPLYTLGQLRTLFWRWRRLMLLTFVVVFVPGALVALLMPPTYEATARMLLRRENRAPDFSVRTSPADGAALFRQVNQREELTTEAERMRSRAVLAPVIDKLELSSDRLNHVRDVRRYVRWGYDAVLNGARTLYDETRYALRISTRPSAEDIAMFRAYALMEDVVRRLRVSVVPDSNILEVSFRSSDAYLAREVCNAIVVQYLTERSPKSREDARQFFLAQSKRMADELRFHEQEVEKLERTFSAYAIDDQQKLLLTSLSANSDQLKATRTELAKLQQKAAMLPKQLADEPATITTSANVTRNPAYDTVSERLVELQLSRVKLLESFQPNSEAVRNLDEQIRVARQLQSEVPPTLAGSTTTSVNPVHQDLRAELLKVNAELAALSAQEQSLLEMETTYRRDLQRLGENGLKVNDSRRLVAAQEQAYLMYLKNQEQARVTEEMESSSLRELRVIDTAPLPLSAISPRPKIYLGLAVGVALLSALGVALLADQNDPYVRDQARVLQTLQLPVLASFPETEVRRLDA